jgi:hypothetical protein
VDTRPPAVLRAQDVATRPGEEMHALTSGPGGRLIAVGADTTAQAPRAWVLTGGRWTQGPGPDVGTGQRAELAGIAAGGSGLVAVGWVAPREGDQPTPAQRRPGVWTSPDARTWTAVADPIDGDAAGVGEFTDVTASPRGGFVATALTWTADPQGGDTVVLTSPDGRRWTRQATEGLDGPGPNRVRRLLAAPGGGLIAVGSRLEGTATEPVVLTAPDDPARWTFAAALPYAGAEIPSAWGLTRSADGGLVAVGFSGSPTNAVTPALWVGREPTAMTSRAVTPGSVMVYAAVATSAGITAVGATPGEAGTSAAAWTLDLR